MIIYQMQGGDDINKLINFFFITFSINFFITIYSIYNFFEFQVFQNKQGMKLNKKKSDFIFEEDEKDN